MAYIDELEKVAEADVGALKKAQVSYGDSWKRRGGVGAFMMAARKWDRMEEQLKKNLPQYDVFQQVKHDQRPEGLIDDIRDLRRYLMLIEAELRATGVVVPEEEKHR